MLETPFIPKDLGSAPIDFPWREIEFHIGPVEEVTPYIKWLGNKTTCGVQTLCSGVMLWGARRLERFVPATHNFELASAGFVGQADRFAVDVQAGPMQKVPDGPKELAAMVGLNIQLRRALDMDEWWDSYFQPVMELSHMVHLVRHILPPTDLVSFDQWLTEVVARVDGVAAKPASPEPDFDDFDDEALYDAAIAPHRGSPLPPDILDTTLPFRVEGCAERATAAVAQIRAAPNRYLRSKAEIAALIAEAGDEE